MIRCQHCGAENADDARFCGSCGRATSATEPTGGVRPGPAPELVGREIAGRYRVLAKLGEGGMGAVYRGEQMSLKRKVAIKLLHPQLSADPGLLRRFNAEAELVAKLGHPNTVNIYDFGQDTDGTLFIAMEYLDGKSLRQVVATEGPLSPRRALHIATQIASSIADAHSHGIVHRDLKPDNVMLTERGKARDIVRVLDFGIAKLRDEQNKTQALNPMTRAGDMVGTPQYMAPEQIRGEAVDGRTDVYALGAILYEMVTGRLVFEGPSLMAILSRHLLDTPEPPTRRRPDLALPAALDPLVASMLAKDPAQRLASMEVANERIAQVAMQVADHTPAPGFPTGMSPAVGTPAPGMGTPPGGQTGPGARLMRPPGVPSTYPPGMMQAPPPGTAPGVPGVRTPPAQMPTPMQPRPMPMPMHPTPMHPMPMPMQPMPMQPMPMRPMPMPMRAPRKGGVPTWVWILIGLAAIGVVGVSVAVSVQKSQREEAEHSRARALEGDMVPAGSYSVRMPLGFIEAPSDLGLGAGATAKVFTGTLDGEYASVTMVAASEDVSSETKESLDDGCGDIARSLFSGTMTGSRVMSGPSGERYRCSISGGGQQVEGAIYSGPAGTLVLFFATDPSAWGDLEDDREELFERRVHVSSEAP